MGSVTKAIICALISGIVGGLTSVLTEKGLAQQAEEQITKAQPVGEEGNSPEIKLPPVPVVVSASSPPDARPHPPEPGTPVRRWTCEEESPDFKQLEYVAETGEGLLALKALVLTQEHRWRFAAADSVVDAAGSPIDFLDYLAKRGLVARIEKAADLVAFGMASCEGTRTVQEDLAGQRAEMINSWLRMIPGDGFSRNYYKVNLGQFRAADCSQVQLSQEQTSPQRRVVIVYTSRDRRPENLGRVELEAKIMEALQAGRSLLFDPADYSRSFALEGS